MFSFFRQNCFYSLASALLLVGGLVSCATSSIIKPELKTELPRDFNSQNELLSGKALLPAHTLELLEVVRKRAELRKGPAITYDLKDKTALKGDVGIPLNTKGVWKKVYLIESGTSGWIHGKTVSSLEGNPKMISVDLKKLPVVAAYKPTKTIYDYPTIKKLDVDIPKGTTFIVFKKYKWRLLVWLPQTNTMAWVAQKDFR
jgi:hypothetical protein